MAINEEQVVNERFWLNLAAEQIYTSFEKRAAAVKNLKLLIEWAFGLFAVTGFVTGIFGKATEFPVPSLVLFGIAFFIFTICYALASEAQFPLTKTFHPNDTEEIAMVVSETVKKQTCLFKWAAGFTLSGFFLVAVGILLLFMNATQIDVPVPTKEPQHVSINCSIEKTATGYNVPITITTSPNADVRVAILKIKEQDSLLFEAPYKTDSSGGLFLSQPLPVMLDSIKVRAHVSKRSADTLIEYLATLRVIRKN